MEQLLTQILQKPEILEFNSLNEEVSNVRNNTISSIKCHLETEEEVIKQLRTDIEINYDVKPIILFLEESNQEKYLSKLGLRKLRYKIVGSHSDLEELRSWDYGVAILP